MPHVNYIPVNSQRCNGRVEGTPNNDVPESWSLPWHALQRSLAQGFGIEISGAASFRRGLSGATFKTVETQSWRVRVREVAWKGG